MAAGGDVDKLAEDLPDGLPKKKFSGKKIILIAAPVLLLAIAGSVAGAFGVFGGGGETTTEVDAHGEPVAQGTGGEHDGKAKAVADHAIPVVFFDLPEILVNLNTGEKKSTFLKISIVLEVDRSSTIPALEGKLPRVMDDFQVYLRELRVEDLSGSAGMFRLKEELLRRVNQSIAPAKVNKVLFKELLVQ